MPSTVSTIETLARRKLQEISASFWTSAELVDDIAAGIRDLWRDIVDLKQEHYLYKYTDAYLAAGSSQLSNVPVDVHKVYLIEAQDLTMNSTNVGLVFRPQEYNSDLFQQSRGREDIDPSNDTIYYAITGQGAPVGAPTIEVAPQVTSRVSLNFVYVPVLGTIVSSTPIPIPGEADNALMAWTVAFARSKEREDRSPDPNWLAIYSTEKTHLLQSLGLRQYQEPTYVDAMFNSYW